MAERDADGKLLEGHSIGEETRFQPGRSGNPSGRPTDERRMESYLQSFQRAMDHVAEADGPTNAMAIINGLVKIAQDTAHKDQARVALALLNKIVPDKITLDLQGDLTLEGRLEQHIELVTPERAREVAKVLADSAAAPLDADAVEGEE